MSLLSAKAICGKSQDRTNGMVTSFPGVSVTVSAIAPAEHDWSNAPLPRVPVDSKGRYISAPSPFAFQDVEYETFAPEGGRAAIVHSEPLASGVLSGPSELSVTPLMPRGSSENAEVLRPDLIVVGVRPSCGPAFAIVNITDILAVLPE